MSAKRVPRRIGNPVAVSILAHKIQVHVFRSTTFEIVCVKCLKYDRMLGIPNQFELSSRGVSPRFHAKDGVSGDEINSWLTG